MFQVQGSIRSSQNLFPPPKRVLFLPEVNQNIPAQNVFVSTMVTSPRSCLSDHLSYNTGFTYNSPKYFKTSIANLSTQNSNVFSPRNRTARIFTSKQKRAQSIRKINSPVKQNFRIINYGPIEMCCANPTPALERKSSAGSFQQNLRASQKIQSTVRFKQPKEIQSRLEYQMSSMQQGRYYDSSEETLPNIDKTYVTALKSQMSSQITHSQVDGLASHASLISREPRGQYITYKYMEQENKNLLQTDNIQNFKQLNPKDQKSETFGIQKKVESKQKTMYFFLAFVISIIITIILLCLG